MILPHDTALGELRAARRRVLSLLLPPPEIGIEEWARKHRVLPAASGRPGEWRADPIQREIQESCCDPNVREVVFQKSTRLGWSEICNNFLGWGIHIHGMAMLMLQPSRDTAEDYCKERLDEMIEGTPALAELIRRATSKEPGSTVRLKRFRNGGSFFVGSAGNPRELRSKRARKVIEDEADGFTNDVSNEGDPDKIVRRRMDEFHDATLLIGSTPGMPAGMSRIEKAYNRSSQGIYVNPCPHCNAMEPFLWRDPSNPTRYLLRFEKDKDNQVIKDSVAWTCIRCGGAIEEKWKYSMMEAGHWLHRRPAITEVKGYWANALYAVFDGHWRKMAQEWVDAQGDSLELKAFINLQLAETFNEPGESVEPSALRKRAAEDLRDRGIVPDGVALVVVTVDVQTAAGGRLECQVTGFKPDERGYLIDLKIIAGDPKQEEVWGDLDAWLLQGWKHQNGATMTAHLTFIDARDGAVKDSIFKFCAPRADRWIFPQMGMHTISSTGWCEESGAKKNTQRFFLTSTDTCKRVLYSRLGMDPNAPKSLHLPDWVPEEYLEQVAAEKRVPVTDKKTRKTTWTWVQTRPRNEGCDLWCYALSGWWALTKILAPHLGGPDGHAHLVELAQTASDARDEVSYANTTGRRIRSKGIY